MPRARYFQLRAFAADETSREAESYERVQALLNTPSAHVASHSGCYVAPYIWDHEATLVLSGGYKFSGIVPEKGFATILSF